MSLHISYRAKNFDEMIGNRTTIKTIESILNRKREDIPHCFLFIGPGGSGKTTMARIVSRLLGCEPEPNNQDFQEINASSKGGVDTAREVESSMRYKPMNKGSEARVYLFEEVQRSSPDFREAMLNKCLEFTPSHVYFILCTTNPEKLGPPTGPFRRRCHTFEMNKLKRDEIRQLVWRVIESEGVEEYFNNEIINAIADESDGSAGAALAILDKIVDLDTEDMLDAIKLSEQATKQVYELCRALLNGNWNDVRKTLWDAKRKEFLIQEDPEDVRRMVLGWMQKVLLNNSKINDQALLVMECFSENFFNTGKAGLTKACADVFS